MLAELDGAHLARVEPLFSPPHLSLVIRAAIRGNSPAHVWVDAPDAPRAALLWDGGHCLYLAGDGRSATFAGRLPELLAHVASRTSAAGLRFFKVQPSDSSWDAVVLDALPGMRRRDRLLLRLGAVRPRPRAPAPAGFQVEPIDGALLESDALRNVGLVRGEIGSMWPSIDRFLGQGFGFVARHGDALVCWCTAEYVSDGACGIGIETIPDFRRRGLATAAAAAFVAECQARSVTPHWDCWRDNYPSARVAEKAGFEPLCSYHVYFGEALSPRAPRSPV